MILIALRRILITAFAALSSVSSLYGEHNHALGEKSASVHNGAWSYQITASGLRAIARSIDLAEDRPHELDERADYQGTRQRYAQLRYGSENSRRVVIVIDDLGSGEYEFYVDADRDRRITSRDIVAGQGGLH